MSFPIIIPGCSIAWRKLPSYDTSRFKSGKAWGYNFYFLQSLCSALFLMLVTGMHAQPTKADYDRAVSFLWENINNKTAFNLSVRVNWFSDSSGCWWLNHSDQVKSFEQYSFESGIIEELFDHEMVAKGLAEWIGEKVDPQQLPFSQIERVDAQYLRFRVKEKHFQIDLMAKKVQEYVPKKEEEGNTLESKSPDGKWIAFEKDYNLFIRSTTTDEEYQLSTAGKKHYEYASYYGWFDKMEGENGERPKRFGVNWSPDSKWLRCNIVDSKYADKMYLLDWSVDSLFRPRLLSYYRGSPGDTTMIHMIPRFFNVETKKEIAPPLPRNTHINAIQFLWADSSDAVYASYADRGYQRETIVQLDLEKNQIDTILTETSKTNIDNFQYWLLEKVNKLVFASERSGWRQLYALDLETRKITAITDGDYYVHSIVKFDEDEKCFYFLAAGKEAGRNPYHQHLYRIQLNGKKLKLLTPEDAHHEVSFSPDGKFFADNYSTGTSPTKTVLRDAKSGKVVMPIAQADLSQLFAKGWQYPQTFEAIGRDGKTPIYGMLWKPTNFDSTKSYPIIDQSYTGPHTQMFPRNIRVALARSNQALAELGFIVVTVDGMGSSGRSKAFHDVSYKNMGMNLLGHVLAIRQLGKKYSWIDTTRVGIFGHSAGGFDAGHAVLQFPDFYKVAVASSADHDFRMEKAWWPEMYMGWPVDSSYHAVSNITMAGNLKGKLLITHGGLDDNVNPSATFKLAEALIKADKEFDLVIFPSQRHGYSGQFSRYFRKKRWNYFVEHLLEAEPIWEIDW